MNKNQPAIDYKLLAKEIAPILAPLVAENLEKTKEERMIKVPEVLEITGYSISTLNRRIVSGDFTQSQEKQGKDRVWKLSTVLNHRKNK